VVLGEIGAAFLQDGEDVPAGVGARLFGQRLGLLLRVADPQPGGEFRGGHVHRAVEVLPQRVEFEGVGHGGVPWVRTGAAVPAGAGRPRWWWGGADAATGVSAVRTPRRGSPPGTSSAASPVRR